MKSEEFVGKKVYLAEIEGLNRRGSPRGRWKDRIKDYIPERDSDRGERLQQAK